MAVMGVLGAAHLGFWLWALARGIAAGVTDGTGAALVLLWLGLIGLWAGFVGRLARSGWLAGAGLPTYPALWISAPAVMLTLMALVAVPALQAAWLGSLALLPAAAVPALNGLRIMAFGAIRKAWRGELPRRIGYGVGIPDFLFGLWSVAVAWQGGFDSGRAAAMWHVVGAAILLAMLPAMFTALLPPRLGAAGKADARAILRYPLVLAPAGFALPFVILHGFALAQLCHCLPRL